MLVYPYSLPSFLPPSLPNNHPSPAPSPAPAPARHAHFKKRRKWINHDHTTATHPHPTPHSLSFKSTQLHSTRTPPAAPSPCAQPPPSKIMCDHANPMYPSRSAYRRPNQPSPTTPSFFFFSLKDETSLRPSLIRYRILRT